MEERSYFAAMRIDSRQIWTLVKITTMACQSQIVLVVRASMLLSDDMFDVERKWAVVLVEPAILATVLRANSDSGASFARNHEFWEAATCC